VPADAVAAPAESRVTAARGILIFLVLLSSYLLSQLPFPARIWEEWLAWGVLGAILVGNVWIFLTIRRAPPRAFVVQGAIAAYAVYALIRTIWFTRVLAFDGVTVPVVLALVLAASFAGGQIVVAALLWRMRRLPSAL
jgi:hypothetical protein